MKGTMKLSELFGRDLTKYDEWDGSLTLVTIEGLHYEEESDEIIFSGKGYFGNDSKIYVPRALVDGLIENGVASATYEIDHCVIKKQWNLKRSY